MQIKFSPGQRNAHQAACQAAGSREGILNCPERAGELAMGKVLFGPESRYAVAPVHTRFDAVQWFVWDAERIDPVTGRGEVIRQEPTLDDACRGLCE